MNASMRDLRKNAPPDAKVSFINETLWLFLPWCLTCPHSPQVWTSHQNFFPKPFPDDFEPPKKIRANDPSKVVFSGLDPAHLI